jgi:hypothetical protein
MYVPLDFSTKIAANRFEGKKDPCVIEVEGSKLLQVWDGFTFAALVFTAVFTPYEVGFVPASDERDIVFWLNMAVNCLFACDIVLQFFLMYHEDHVGGQWVANHRRIIRHYVGGWFVIDICSTVPMDVITTAIGLGGGDKLRIVRVIRLLRLLKLARLLRASRIFKRWQTLLTIPFYLQSLLKYMMIIVVTGHWMACGWGIAEDMEDEGVYTWKDKFSDNQVESDLMSAEEFRTQTRPWDHYCAALYWSIMTLTGIGYGDIVPLNTFERNVVTFFMLVGGCCWTFVLGSMASVFTTVSADGNTFNARLDLLNQMLTERNLDQDLRLRIRNFYHQAREARVSAHYTDLIEEMSPALQGEVALACNRLWVDSIWWLNGASQEFVLCLVSSVVTMLYAQREVFTLPFTLFVLSRGIVARKASILRHGAVWGEDQVLLKSWKLMDHSTCVALTFVEVYTLSRDRLDSALARFPEDARLARKAYVRRVA